MREEGRGRTSKVAGRKSKVQGPVGEGGRKVNQGGIEGVKERRSGMRKGDPIGNEGVGRKVKVRGSEGGGKKGKTARLRSGNYGAARVQSWLEGGRARAASQAAGDGVFKRK